MTNLKCGINDHEIHPQPLQEIPHCKPRLACPDHDSVAFERTKTHRVPCTELRRAACVVGTTKDVQRHGLSEAFEPLFAELAEPVTLDTVQFPSHVFWD